jgi:hypothetical protein
MAPNYYLLLLDALPKSAIYFEGGDGTPVFINGKSEIEGRYVLDRFRYTKTSHREDGTYTIVPVMREDTGDTAKFTHYIVDNPPLAPPAPLTDHPFLSVHPDPVKLESTEPLPELLPTMEAVFEHAVPETNDPYTEGLKYMKIYDIGLRDVPNALWTKKFPPVAVVDESPPPTELSFTARDQDSVVLLSLFPQMVIVPDRWRIPRISYAAIPSRRCGCERDSSTHRAARSRTHRWHAR